MSFAAFGPRAAAILLLLGLYFSGVAVLHAGSLEGVLSEGGRPVPAVRVQAAALGLEAGGKVFLSPPSAEDGRYRMELPAGYYRLIAFTGAAPAEGGLFGMDADGPVFVPEDAVIRVQIALAEVPAQPAPVSSPQSGIAGVVQYEGGAVERSYLYLYSTADKGFKGPGDRLIPLENGSFDLSLPEGDYYVIARKRRRGGAYGPLAAGDLFGYFHGNPIRVVAGVKKKIVLPLIEKRDPLEVVSVEPLWTISGRIVGRDGRPLEGGYVLVYDSKELKGVPAFSSLPTGPDGSFTLNAQGPGQYYLKARSQFAGPATQEEFTGGLRVELSQGSPNAKVEIHVERTTEK